MTNRPPKQTSRRDLIKRLKEMGFSGPHVGTGRHPEFMKRGDLVLKLPNVHRGDIGLPLLKAMLNNAGLTMDDWLSNG